MNKSKAKVGTVSAHESFLSYFGVTAQVLSIVWDCFDKDTLPNGAKEDHLLWGCMLMKQYTGDRDLAASAGVDKQTFVKWAWIMIDEVLWLEADFVTTYLVII